MTTTNINKKTTTANTLSKPYSALLCAIFSILAITLFSALLPLHANAATKSVLLKNSIGTYGKPGYYSSEFYTRLPYEDSWLTTDDKSVYNPELAKFSVILSSAIYDGVSCMVDTLSFSSEKTVLLDSYDYIDTELLMISVSSSEVTQVTDPELIDSEDATTIVLGHKPVEIDGKAHDIYIIVIRGTKGAAEWESNYDVGCIGEEYIQKTGEHPEWTDYDNHKGFDVAANRVGDLLKSYIEKNHTDNSTIDILVTGHSRGAGIANILGAKLENEGYNSCAYTFASPNTTTNPQKFSTKTVFNIINSNDFITTLPLEEWGFMRYGTDIKVDVANTNEVFSLVSKSLGMDYAGKDPEFLVGAFSGLACSRDELYIDEVCECSFDTAAEKDEAFQNAKAAVEYLRLGNFIHLEDYSAPNSEGKYHYDETLSIGALMVGLSRIMSDQSDFLTMFVSINHIRNVYPQNSQYSSALDNFLNALTDNLMESFYPHMTTCYYSIVENQIDLSAENSSDSSTQSINTTATADSIKESETQLSEAGNNNSPLIFVIIATTCVAIIVTIILVIKRNAKKS